MTQEPSNYRIETLSKYRHIFIETLRQASRQHTIHALTEVDVTRARQYLRANKARTGESLSFTAFITACLAKAVHENKQVQSYRKGSRRLVIFEDVDIDILVERRVKGGSMPLSPLTIRAANQKDLLEIHREIRASQGEEIERTQPTVRGFNALPTFLAVPVMRVFWWWFMRNPQLRTRFGGTVAITSVGMFGEGGGWGIPVSSYTLTITLGGISEKPGVIDGQITIREYLDITLSFNHDVVDGAPAARFTQRLKELIEGGYGLEVETP